MVSVICTDGVHGHRTYKCSLRWLRAASTTLRHRESEGFILAIGGCQHSACKITNMLAVRPSALLHGEVTGAARSFVIPSGDQFHHPCRWSHTRTYTLGIGHLCLYGSPEVKPPTQAWSPGLHGDFFTNRFNNLFSTLDPYERRCTNLCSDAVALMQH